MQITGGTPFLPLLLAMRYKPDLSTSLFQLKDGAKVGQVTFSEPPKHQAHSHAWSRTLLQAMEPSTSPSYEQGQP